MGSLIEGIANSVKTHDINGNFAVGNPGGPGRPRKKPTTKAMLKALAEQAVMFLSDLMHSDDKELAIKACIEILRFSLSQENSDEKSETVSGLSIEDFVKYMTTLPSDSNPDSKAPWILPFQNPNSDE